MQGQGMPGAPPPPPDMNAPSMMAESEIGSWAPFSTRKGGFVGLFVGGALLLLIGILLTFVFVPVGAFFIVIGVILFVVAVLRMRKPKIRYVLTNRRAMVTSTKNKQQTTLQACELATATVSVLNRRQITVTKSRSSGLAAGGIVGAGIGLAGGGTSRSVGQSDQVGDVIFLIGGLPQVRFVGVNDPDGVQNTAKEIIANLRGTQS